MRISKSPSIRPKQGLFHLAADGANGSFLSIEMWSRLERVRIRNDTGVITYIFESVVISSNFPLKSTTYMDTLQFSVPKQECSVDLFSTTLKAKHDTACGCANSVV
jgi:hypothetical protein